MNQGSRLDSWEESNDQKCLQTDLRINLKEIKFIVANQTHEEVLRYILKSILWPTLSYQLVMPRECLEMYSSNTLRLQWCGLQNGKLQGDGISKGQQINMDAKEWLVISRRWHESQDSIQS